jgi:hypothetical protein
MNLDVCERERSYPTMKEFLSKIFEQRDLLHKTKNEPAGSENTFTKYSKTFYPFRGMCGSLYLPELYHKASCPLFTP